MRHQPNDYHSSGCGQAGDENPHATCGGRLFGRFVLMGRHSDSDWSSTQASGKCRLNFLDKHIILLLQTAPPVLQRAGSWLRCFRGSLAQKLFGNNEMNQKALQLSSAGRDCCNAFFIAFFANHSYCNSKDASSYHYVIQNRRAHRE
jgi:hypothetical protein